MLTVGDATAQAVRAAGFADVRSAAGDLSDLAAMVRSDAAPADRILLHPVAREPAGDLAAAVGDAAAIRSLAVYEAVETAVAAPAAFDVVLIHSPRAARAVAGRLTPQAARGRRAVVLSPAAAAPLAHLPFARIDAASVPTEPALLGLLGVETR